MNTPPGSWVAGYKYRSLLKQTERRRAYHREAHVSVTSSIPLSKLGVALTKLRRCSFNGYTCTRRSPKFAFELSIDHTPVLTFTCYPHATTAIAPVCTAWCMVPDLRLGRNRKVTSERHTNR